MAHQLDHYINGQTRPPQSGVVNGGFMGIPAALYDAIGVSPPPPVVEPVAEPVAEPVPA